MCCILSKSLNAYPQPLTTKQMISLRLVCQKKNKGNDQLKKWEIEAMTNKDTGIKKTTTIATKHHRLWIPEKESTKFVKLRELQSVSWKCC